MSIVNTVEEITHTNFCGSKKPVLEILRKYGAFRKPKYMFEGKVQVEGLGEGYSKNTFHWGHMDTNGTKHLSFGVVLLWSLDLPNCGSNLVLFEIDLSWLISVHC